MKGLLHSKRFKKLLKKWIFMYVGVMLLFTSVVTYAKYISNQTSVDKNGKVTLFNVTIRETNQDGIACNICSQQALIDDTIKCTGCTTEEYVATNVIKYYFTVNTDELEAAAEIKITVNANGNFNIMKIKDVTNSTVEEEKLVYESNNTPNNNLLAEFTVISDLVNKGDTLYEVSVQYRPNDKTISASPFTDVITVGLSAEQVTKGGL